MKLKRFIQPLVLLIPVLLAGCSAPKLCNGLIPGACTAAHQNKLGEAPEPFKNQAKYLFTPAKIYRAYITRHLSSDGEVIGDHYAYWHTRGHWNVPNHAASGIGSDLLGPANEELD